MPWNFVVMLIISVALSALSYILTPKPKTEKLKPANKIDIPATDMGREIPVIFGTVMIRDPNIVWFGHMKIKAVKKKGGKK